LKLAVRRSAAMIIQTLRTNRAARMRRSRRWPVAPTMIVLIVVGIGAAVFIALGR
jgi:hypothetical protein